MTHELEELLSAAKVMAMENNVIEVERLHKAITAFEAVRAIAPNPKPLNQVTMRGDQIPASLHYGAEPFGSHNEIFIIKVYRVAQNSAPPAPDPYDFENHGLRKET
jgi:hypothetical protein